MAKYIVETDQGRYEIETEEPSRDHPDFMAPGVTKDFISSAVDKVSPRVDIPTDTSIPGIVSRGAKATGEALLAPVAPFIPGLRKRMLSPVAGQVGPARVLEEEGRRVGGAVRASAQTIADTMAESKVGQKAPYLTAALGSGLATFADAASDSLTPSAQQQNIGSEGLGQMAKPLSAILRKQAIDPARRALGFQKSQLMSTKSPFESGRKLAQANMAAEQMLERGKIPFLGSPTKIQKNALDLLSEGRKETGTAISSIDVASGPRQAGSVGPQEKIFPEVFARFWGPQEKMTSETGKALESARKVLPDLPSYDQRVTLKQRFVKAKIQAADVVNRVARERKVPPSKDLFDKLFDELHNQTRLNVGTKGYDLTPQQIDDLVKIGSYKTLSDRAERLVADEQAFLRIKVSDFDDIFTSSVDPKNDAELSAAIAARRDVSDQAVNGNLTLEGLDYLREYWGQLGFQDKTVGSSAANVYRKAWKAAGNFLKEHISSVDPELGRVYSSGMKKQEVAMTSLKGITNKMSAEAGNMPISFPGIVVGASQGNLPKALASAGIFEAVKRRGASVSANILSKTAKGIKSGARPGAFTALITAARRRSER